MLGVPLVTTSVAVTGSTPRPAYKALVSPPGTALAHGRLWYPGVKGEAGRRYSRRHRQIQGKPLEPKVPSSVSNGAVAGGKTSG